MKPYLTLKGLRNRAVIAFIQIIFVILKLTNILNWSWIWIFAPTWIWVLIVLIATIYVINKITK